MVENIGIPDPKIEKLRKWLTRFLASESYSQPFFDKGKENYKLYKSYKDSSEKPYKHDIFVPYCFAYAEDMASYMMLSVLASPITYAYEPRKGAISLELCQEMEQLAHWALTEETTEFVLELEEIIKSINLFNIGYLINYPVVEDRRIVNKKGQPVVTPCFERLHLDCPSPLDVFVEPNVKRISRMNWVVKRSWEYIDNLKKLEGPGGYFNVDSARGGVMETDPVGLMLSSIGLSATQPYYDEKNDRVELLDCMQDGEIVTLAGRKTIIQDTSKREVKPSLFEMPILDCRMSGAPGEFFGIGIVESIKPTQVELNILRSQRRDNIALLLNKMFMYDIMAGEIDLSTLFSAPGNVIMGSNIHEALQELQISDVTASSFKESQELQYDLQNISSMWDYARGGTPRRRETATGIVRLQQAAQSRNEWLLRKLDAYILQPLARRLIVYLREYLPRDDYVEIIGKTDNHADEFYDLDPKKLKKMFNVMPLTESIISIKEVNLNQLLQAFDRLIQLPEVNRPGLVKQLLLRLGQKDIKKILPDMTAAAQEGIMATMEGMEQGGEGGGQMPPGGGMGGGQEV